MSAVMEAVRDGVLQGQLRRGIAAVEHRGVRAHGNFPAVPNGKICAAIIAAVGAAFGLTREELMAPGRANERITWARFIGFHLARKAGFCLKEIAAAFGRNYHKSVSYGLESMRDRMDVDPEFKKFIETLEGLL